MQKFDWPKWFREFEIKINRSRSDGIGALLMQGQQLADAMNELTGAVNQAVAAVNNQTPDSVVAPAVEQLKSLAAALKSAYPQTPQV